MRRTMNEPIAPPAVEPNNPRADIISPLWRLKRAARTQRLMPFVGYPVKIERWLTRVASGGDQTYQGTLLAVAASTTRSTADFAIIQTTAGNVWAISTAQIAYMVCTLRKGK